MTLRHKPTSLGVKLARNGIKAKTETNNFHGSCQCLAGYERNGRKNQVLILNCRLAYHKENSEHQSDLQ